MNISIQKQFRMLAFAGMAAMAGVFFACGDDDGGDNPGNPVVPQPDPVPTITAISPESGLEGDEITITGTNFSDTASVNVVTFSGNVTATVSAASETSLTVTVPVGAESGPITVTRGSESASSSSDFTVLESQTVIQRYIEENTGVELLQGTSFVGNLGRGYQFSPSENGEITAVAVHSPVDEDVTLYVWADENQTLLDSLTITPDTTFSYTNLDTPIPLTQGKDYTIVMYDAKGAISLFDDFTYPTQIGSINIKARASFSGSNMAIFPDLNSSVTSLSGMVDFIFVTEK